MTHVLNACVREYYRRDSFMSHQGSACRHSSECWRACYGKIYKMIIMMLNLMLIIMKWNWGVPQSLVPNSFRESGGRTGEGPGTGGTPVSGPRSLRGWQSGEGGTLVRTEVLPSPCLSPLIEVCPQILNYIRFPGFFHS